jgi:hypothetical protein
MGGKETDIFTSVGNYLSTGGLMAVPEDVRLHDVEAAVLGLLYQIRPHLRTRRNKQATKRVRHTPPTAAAGQLARISGERRTPCSEGGRRGARKRRARTSGTLLG